MKALIRKKCAHFSLPRRIIVIILSFLALSCNFITTRLLTNAKHVNVEVVQDKDNKANTTKINCPQLVKNNTEKKVKSVPWSTYKWPEDEAITITELFHWGFFLPMVLGGCTADMYGAKYVVLAQLLFTTLVTLIAPVTFTSVEFNVNASKAINFLFGLASGGIVAPVVSLLSHWIPPRERGTLTAITLCGLISGILLGNEVFDAATSAFENWSISFYIFGSMEVVFCIIWYFFVFSTPHEHPTISTKERDYLDKEMEEIVDHRRKKIPFWKMLKSLPAWAACVALFGHIFAWELNGKFMGDYEKHILQSDVEDSHFRRSFPSIILIVCMIFNGCISDWINNHNYMNVISLRKVCINIALMGPQIFLLASTYAECSKNAVDTMFIIANFVNGGFVAIRFIFMDISPNFCGTLSAVGATLVRFVIIFLPRIMRKMVPTFALEEYQNLLWMAFGVALFTNFFFVLFGSSDLEEWNNTSLRDDNKDKEQ